MDAGLLFFLILTVYGLICVLTKPKEVNPFKPPMNQVVNEDFSATFLSINKFVTAQFLKDTSGSCRKHSNKLRYSHNAKIKRRNK